MKKLLLTFTASVLIIGVGCSSNKTKADAPAATYIQSDDQNSPFDRVVIVDNQTGCRYLAIVEYGGGRSSITPMYQSDGKPSCN